MKSLPGTKYLLILIALCIVIPEAGTGQTQLVSGDFFPADLEFRELQKVKSEDTDVKSAGLSASDLRLFEETGYDRFARRIYDVAPAGSLSIEVLTARDDRSAFSIFTLLRSGPAKTGPPGDWIAEGDDSLTFCRSNFWVRLRAKALPDLMRRVAISVSNRIGLRSQTVPSLITHLPKNGLDSSTIRYFIDEHSFNQYASKLPSLEFKFGPEMEVAQAAYELQGQSGTLFLVSFPTAQMADDYFDRAAESFQSGSFRIFARKVGPLLGILTGGFEPETADSILGGIKFSYTIKWIYDKNNNSSKTLWGVPVKILGTVVRSLALTALLCFGSIFLGVGIALFRVILRGYAPGNYFDRPDRTEMIRLRLNEPESAPSEIGQQIPDRQK